MKGKICCLSRFRSRVQQNQQRYLAFYEAFVNAPLLPVFRLPALDNALLNICFKAGSRWDSRSALHLLSGYGGLHSASQVTAAALLGSKSSHLGSTVH